MGVGGMAAGLSGMLGDRMGGTGGGASAHFELVIPTSPTALGHLLGLELQTEIGYESYAVGELVFDLGIGFPMTLLHLGEGGVGTTIVSMALGAGLNVQHAYGYVRGRVLTKLSDDLYVELMGRWTPQEASTAWVDDGAGLEAYAARASVYLALDDEMGLQVFGEWSPADIASARPEDPENIAKFPGAEVDPYQSVMRLGVGLMF